MEELLSKYFSGNASQDEILEVNNWKSESETNAKTFIEAKSVWLGTEPTIPAPQAVLNDILGENEPKQVHIFMRSWVKYASAAILVLAISLLFILNQNSSSGDYENQTLSDGSLIELHRNSDFEVVNIDDNIREVRVSGKAYFDINRDETRPFIIHTDNAKVTVLGTSFLVNAEDGKTEVSVESGLVEFAKNDSGLNPVSVKLTKGETGLVYSSNTGIIKKNNNDANYLSWKTKVITFDEDSMEEVEAVLEDVYGIDVVFENPDFKNCKLTAKFNKKKAKDAIEIIARTFGMDYEFKKNEAILKGKGC